MGTRVLTSPKKSPAPAAWDASDEDSDTGSDKPKKSPAPAAWDASDEDTPAPAPKSAPKSTKDTPAPAPKSAPKSTKAASPVNASTPAAVGPEEIVKVVQFDSMADLKINLQMDVDTLVAMALQKVSESQAKRAQKVFLEDVVARLQGKLSLPELEAFHKSFKELHTKRKKVEAERKKQEAKAEA